MSNEITLTFDNAKSLSNEFIDVDSQDKLIGLFFADGFNTTQCTFAGYDNDDNEYSVNDLSGSEVNITVSQSVDGYYPLDPAIFVGLNKLKLRRGTQGSPFTTNAENTIILAVRRKY